MDQNEFTTDESQCLSRSSYVIQILTLLAAAIDLFQRKLVTSGLLVPEVERDVFISLIRKWLNNKEGSFEILSLCNLSSFLQVVEWTLSWVEEADVSFQVLCNLLKMVTLYYKSDWAAAADIKLIEDPTKPDIVQYMTVQMVKYRHQALMRCLTASPHGAMLPISDMPDEVKLSAVEANNEASISRDPNNIELHTLELEISFARNEGSVQYFKFCPEWQDSALQIFLQTLDHDSLAKLFALRIHASRILYSVEDRRDLPSILEEIELLSTQFQLPEVFLDLGQELENKCRNNAAALYCMVQGDALVTELAPVDTWGLMLWERHDADFYDRQFETVLREKPHAAARARKSTSLATHSMEAIDAAEVHYAKAFTFNPLADSTRARILLSQGFLAVLRASALSPTVHVKLWTAAHQKIKEASECFNQCGDSTGYLVAQVQKTLIEIILGRGGIVLDTVASEVGQWGRQRGGFAYAAGLGHFCSAMGRCWLASFGDFKVAYQCHQFASLIFSHLGAHLAKAMSLTILASLVFQFGRMDKIHKDIRDGRNLAFESQLLLRALYEAQCKKENSNEDEKKIKSGEHQLTKTSEFILHCSHRSCDLLYNHLVGFDPEDREEALAIVEDMIKFEDINAWRGSFGYDGRLREWTTVPVDYSGDDCMPPELLDWSRSLSPQPRFKGHQAVAKFAKRADDAALFEEHTRKAEDIAKEWNKGKSGLVFSLLMSSVLRIREELPEAAAKYTEFLDSLQRWQAELRDSEVRKWSLSCSGEDAMNWYYRADRVEETRKCWEALAALNDEYEQLARENWRTTAILAYCTSSEGDKVRGKQLFDQALRLYEKEKASQGQLELRTALASDLDVGLLHFRAAKANFVNDAFDALAEGGSWENAYTCIERGKAREVMDRVMHSDEGVLGSQSLSTKEDALANLIVNFRGNPARLDLLRRSFEEQRKVENNTVESAMPLTVDIEQFTDQKLVTGLQATKDILPANSIMLYYAYFSDTLFRWAIPGGTQRGTVCLGTRIRAYEIRQRAKAFVQCLSVPPFICGDGSLTAVQKRSMVAQRRKIMKENGDWLTKLLLEPFVDLLPSRGHLFIVPHADLHSLPFEALPWKKGDGKYFGLESGRTISYVPCSSILRHLQKEPISSGKLLIVDVGMRLRKVSEEVQAIKSHNSHSTILSETEATAENIMAALNRGEYSSLHFSGHGLFDKYAPRNSSLVLSEERMLTLFEIQCATRGGLQQVSLAACHAGETHRTLGGDDTQGFAQYFLGTGVKQVTAPLWEAEDNASCDLMTGLHGIGAENIFEARREVAKREPDPYFWAPFVVFGCPFLS